MKTLNIGLYKCKVNMLMISLLAALSLASCKKFIEVEAPVTTSNSTIVFSTDASAASALSGIYAGISNASFTSGGITSLSLVAGLSADELTVFNYTAQPSQISTALTPYYQNSLTSQSSGIHFWNNVYPVIYYANSAIEGLQQSTTLTPSVRNQLMGEALFIRAFCNFYLVNLYGDVPLALSTDYDLNRLLPRTQADRVYLQIIEDLIKAKGLLNANYLGSDIKTQTSERTTPNKAVASALLARVYLYHKEYSNAESEAGAVIANSAYKIIPLSDVFLKNSQEAIWQLQPVGVNPSNTKDARMFLLPSTGPNLTATYPVYLSPLLMGSFEPGDNRRSIWTATATVGANSYPYPVKYRNNGTSNTVTEYTMIIRMAEMYLIRSEARAQQNKVAESQSDLNILRTRAGLGATTANDRASLLAAILKERQAELFTEFGHRWLDLKRTENVNAVLQAAATNKGTVWKSSSGLYPIPETDLFRNPNLANSQNPGY